MKSTAYLSVANPFHNTPIATPYLEVPVLRSGNAIWQPPRG